MATALIHTDLPLSNKRSGKVRDVYDVTLGDGSEGLLIVATDRISAFDVVMRNGLPGKGIVLTQISKFWFDHFDGKIQHHLLSTDVKDTPGLSDEQRAALTGRVMLCKKTNVVPIECIARGYLAGSGFKDYQRTGNLCGITLPRGLVNADRLPEPLFTPSTKAASGHDENISFEQGVALVGAPTMQWLKDTTLTLYAAASDYAASRGILLADTKFEFGVPVAGGSNGKPILIDEIVTPDSSRFWPKESWQPGREQESFDKQIVRNYLETLVAAGEWDKNPPGPELPAEVVDRTLARYREAFERLTGRSIAL